MSVRLEITDGVALITLDRPEVRNAVDRPTAQTIADSLDEIDGRPDVRAAVFTGSGRTFSAGMDLKVFHATGELPLVEGRGAFGIVERPPAVPIIAAVEGQALGGGFEIALACDLIVAAEGAVFGLPEVKLGAVAAAGGVLRLPQRVPRSVAMELVLTGAPVDATRAHQLGLVNRVVPAGSAVQVALALAAEIAANAPMAVRTAKYLVDASRDWPQGEAFARQAPYTEALRASADATEGPRAFVEKRPPRWTGA